MMNIKNKEEKRLLFVFQTDSPTMPARLDSISERLETRRSTQQKKKNTEIK